MGVETVTLRDLMGPYAGQLREYVPHAAQNAIQQGWAEYPSTEIPPEFPARDELVAAGFQTLEAVPTTVEELTALPGVGKKTAQKILGGLEG